MSTASPFSENARGILFMLGSSIGFILSDTFVKLATETLSVGQVVALRSIIALPVVVIISVQQGAFSNFRLNGRVIWLRTVGEIGATAFYLAALARMNIANATAVIQIIPLAVTAAAAIVLGERVGIRRWTAILIGLGAVLMIIRPGMEGFNIWSLSALAAVGFIALRDLSSRKLPEDMHPLAVVTLSLVAMIVLGLIMLPFSFWGPLTMGGLFLCAGSGLLLSFAFLMIIEAMRHGEIAVISPFRYSVMLFAILVQILVFAVWPDALTLIGSAVLIATGLYTLYRERKVKIAGAAMASEPAARTLPR